MLVFLQTCDAARMRAHDALVYAHDASQGGARMLWFMLMMRVRLWVKPIPSNPEILETVGLTGRA